MGALLGFFCALVAVVIAIVSCLTVTSTFLFWHWLIPSAGGPIVMGLGLCTLAVLGGGFWGACNYDPDGRS